MKCSGFAPVGLLRMRGGEPAAKAIYRTMADALNAKVENFDLTKGTHAEAKLFATALMLARAERLLWRAGRQSLPKYALDLLRVLEAEYGLQPAPVDTVKQRRTALTVAKRLLQRATATVITLALQESFGDDFIEYRPTPVAEAAYWPTVCGTSPMNLQLSTVKRKRITIPGHISTNLGSPHTVIYEPKSEESVLIVGDVLVLSPENSGIAERVDVDAVGIEILSESTYARTFTFTPTKPHPKGTIGVTWSFPWWTSSKRHSLVVMTEEAALDPEKRRRVHALMHRMVRGTSTWDIAAGHGPFKVGVGKLGITTIGSIV